MCVADLYLWMFRELNGWFIHILRVVTPIHFFPIVFVWTISFSLSFFFSFFIYLCSVYMFIASKTAFSVFYSTVEHTKWVSEKCNCVTHIHTHSIEFIYIYICMPVRQNGINLYFIIDIFVCICNAIQRDGKRKSFTTRETLTENRSIAGC